MKFFHAMAKSGAAVACVDAIVDDLGVGHHGSDAIHAAAVGYFERLLSSMDHILNEELLNLIPCMVTEEENAHLVEPFVLEEVRVATFSTPLDASPGLDGFSAAFFTSSWNLVKMDILNAMNELLSSAYMPTYLAHTAIALIPKKNVVESLADYRPISLCSMVYKIFSKLLCNRLVLLLPKLISPNQSALVQGRSIFDNISLTQEICREVGKPNGKPNVVLSLTLSKSL